MNCIGCWGHGPVNGPVVRNLCAIHKIELQVIPSLQRVADDVCAWEYDAAPYADRIWTAVETLQDALVELKADMGRQLSRTWVP